MRDAETLLSNAKFNICKIEIGQIITKKDYILQIDYIYYCGLSEKLYFACAIFQKFDEATSYLYQRNMTFTIEQLINLTK